jgi:hypothetical protein
LQNAAIAMTNEFPKAASTYINQFTKAAGNLMKKSVRNYQAINTGTNGLWKLF